MAGKHVRMVHTRDPHTPLTAPARVETPDFEQLLDVSEQMQAIRRDQMKRNITRVMAVVLIVLSICIGAFPSLMQYRSARELTRVSNQSAKTVEQWPYPKADDEIAAAKAYNQRLAASGQPILGEARDPFASTAGVSRADGSDSASSNDKEYQSLLDSGSGVMGTIRISKISVDLPIYHGTSQSVLASGAGHLYGTSLPVGGKSTHAVITGHRGMLEAAMFTRLDEMHIGDYFYIKVMGHTLGYKVDRITVIEPNDTSQLRIVPGEDRVTLMTCTPYGVNTQRLLVSAVRSAIPNGIPYEQDAAPDARAIAIGVGVAMLVCGLLIIAIVRGHRRSAEVRVIRRHAAE